MGNRNLGKWGKCDNFASVSFHLILVLVGEVSSSTFNSKACRHCTGWHLIWGEGKQRKDGVHTANSSHRTPESSRTPSSTISPWSHPTDTWSRRRGTWSLPWEHLIHRQETPRPPPSSRYATSRLTLASTASSNR